METTVASMMCAPENSTTAPYTRSLLEIEENFALCQVYTWHTNNWTLCFPFIGVYLVAIFGGREYMRSRSPFRLRGALVLWNAAMATFSIVASWRMVTTAIYAIHTYGFQNSLCTIDPFKQRQAVGFWMFLYLLSKIVEFGDTVFIVLRKTPLTFLHCYHHVTVAFMVWSVGAYASPMFAYFCLINLLVHSVMYSYYALKVLGIRISKGISMAITVLQLTQMVAGIAITAYVYRVKAAGRSCPLPFQAVAIAGSIYFSYLLLFLNFFIRAYVTGRKQPAICHSQLKKQQ